MVDFLKYTKTKTLGKRVLEVTFHLPHASCLCTSRDNLVKDFSCDFLQMRQAAHLSCTLFLTITDLLMWTNRKALFNAPYGRSFCHRSCKADHIVRGSI